LGSLLGGVTGTGRGDAGATETAAGTRTDLAGMAHEAALASGFDAVTWRSLPAAGAVETDQLLELIQDRVAQAGAAGDALLR